MASVGYFGSPTRWYSTGFVAALHIVLIGGLIVSLGDVVRPVAPEDLQITVIDQVVERWPTPPREPTLAPLPVAPPPDDVVSVPIEGATGPTVTSLVPPSSDPRHTNARPDYPEASIRLGEEGSVVLKVLVDVAGRVTDVQIARSSGFERLDQAALRQARSFRFRAGSANGQPMAMWHQIKVSFRLEDARG